MSRLNPVYLSVFKGRCVYVRGIAGGGGGVECGFLTQQPAVADLGGVQRFPWNPPFWLSPK